MWLLNFLLLLYWLWKPSWWVAFTVAALVGGFGIVKDSVAISVNRDRAEDCFQVLSYNVSHFNTVNYRSTSDDSSALNKLEKIQAFINWNVSNPAAIKCFQEFYTHPGDPLFDVDESLRQEGWKHAFISADTLKYNKSRFGVAIYSKFSMLDQGVIFIGAKRFNRGIWADIRIGDDTLRVINVHFASAQLQQTRQKSSGTKDAIKRMQWMYRASLKERNQQLKQVLDFLDKSPHPVLLCGDLNSTPYSHVYQQLDAALNNAFEQEGNGFGFTFNHPKLFFLRIDHQFVSDELETCEFKALEEIKYSAHFPLEGFFRFKETM